MLDLVDPWKWITIQLDRKYIISFLGFLAEHKTFSLGFVRVFMSAELKIFAGGNFLADIHHCLQARPAARDEKNVVSISKTAQEQAIDMASKPSIPKDDKQFINID